MKLVNTEKKDNGKSLLTISVEKEAFQAAVKKSIQNQAKKMTLPGFRKGKAPINIVVKYCGGEQAFYEDAVNEMYPAAYNEAITASGIEPVERAEINVTELNENGFTFTAEVTVKPEVKLGKYKGLEVEKTLYPVDDATVETELKKMQEQAGREVKITDRAAQEGDIANINYEGFVGDEAFEGGKGDNQDLKLGSGTFIPGFEEQIVGKSIDEEFDVKVTFPEEYHAPELAGKEAIFKCKLNELKKIELPELDDEFAKDISEFDSIAALKEDIKAKIAAHNDQNANNEVEDRLVDQVIENIEVTIPDCMIESALDGMEQDFDYRLNMQGLNLEQYLQMTGMDKESFRKTFRDQAEKKTKIRLALEEIVKAENITATEEDLEAEFKKIADSYNMPVEDVKKYIPAAEISGDIAVRKAVQVIVAEAKVTEKEFVAENNDETAPKKTTKKAAAKKDDAEEKSAKKAAPKKAASTVKKAAPKKTAKKEADAE